MRLLEARTVRDAVDATRGRVGHFHEERWLLEGDAPLSLLRRRNAEGATRGPVLLVHGFGQNRASWHLPSRSLLNHLAAAGHELFALDLQGHGASRALGARVPHSMAAHLHDVARARDAVASLAGAPLALVGHSMGALLCLLSAGLEPRGVARVAALAVPFRFGRGSWFLRGFSHAVGLAHSLGAHRVPRARLPVHLLGPLFHATRPLWNSSHLPLPVRAWKPGAFEPSVLREFLSLSFDHDALGVLREFAHLSAQGSLPEGELGRAYSHTVAHFELPLLVVGAAHDQLAPLHSVRPAFDELGSRDKHWACFDAGHGDLLLGRDAPGALWPRLTGWLRG